MSEYLKFNFDSYFMYCLYFKSEIKLNLKTKIPSIFINIYENLYKTKINIILNF